MNLPGGNDGNPPGRTELTSIRLRALAATHMPFIAPHLVAWPRPHGTVVCHTPCYVRRIRTIICVAYCHIMRFAIYVTVSDVLVTTSIDLCVNRASEICPGSPFRLFLSNRDRNTLEKSPIQQACNIRHHTSAEFRASRGFAYIERVRDGLSRFGEKRPKSRTGTTKSGPVRTSIGCRHHRDTDCA